MNKRKIFGAIIKPSSYSALLNMPSETVGEIVKNIICTFEDKELLHAFNDPTTQFLSDDLCDFVKYTKEAKERNSIAGKISAEKKKSTQVQRSCNESATKVQHKCNGSATEAQQTRNHKDKNKNKDKDNNNSIVTEIVNYLNKVTKKNYQPKGKTAEYINARLNEGYTPDDLKKVIDIKYREWKGTKYETFVRPSTLFAPSHFEEYLNQPETPSAKPNGFTTMGTERDYNFDELEKRLVKN